MESLFPISKLYADCRSEILCNLDMADLVAIAAVAEGSLLVEIDNAIHKRKLYLFGSLLSDYERLLQGQSLKYPWNPQEPPRNYRDLISDAITRCKYETRQWKINPGVITAPKDANCTFQGNYEYALLSAFKYEISKSQVHLIRSAVWKAEPILDELEDVICPTKFANLKPNTANLVEYR